MRELFEDIKSLPHAEVGKTPEDFKVIAERTLENREKMIYYLGNVELLLEAYEQAYEDDYYIPTRIKLGIFVKILAPDTRGVTQVPVIRFSGGAGNPLSAR